MSEVETDAVVRGFSYPFLCMSKSVNDICKVNEDAAFELQYVEGSELERAWKAERRQRIKNQEAKIWDDYVNEQDALNKVLQINPYQFLDELPISHLEELLFSKNSNKTKVMTENGDGHDDNPLKENPETDNKDDEEKDENEDDESNENEIQTARNVSNVNLHSLTEANEDEMMMANNVATNETAELDESSTTEEKDSQNCDDDNTLNKAEKLARAKSKNSMAHLIENSIYCAKAKELRIKIKEAFLETMTLLENKLFLPMEPSEITKLRRCAAEFAARYNRNQLYQLKRMHNDLERHNSYSLPFAKHTQFQSQMVRVVSAHQNLLHAVLLLNKSFERTWFLFESAACVRSLSAVARALCLAAAAVPRPADCSAADTPDRYNDYLMAVADKLDVTLDEYQARAEDCFLKKHTCSTEKLTTSAKKSRMTCDARLSMYSIASSKKTPLVSASSEKVQKKLQATKELDLSDAKKKKKKALNPPLSNRARRPLMRDPQEGIPKTNRIILPDADIRTLVENVVTSTVDSPIRKIECSQRNKELATPRDNLLRSPRKPLLPSPSRSKKLPKKIDANAVQLVPIQSQKDLLRYPKRQSPRTNVKVESCVSTSLNEGFNNLEDVQVVEKVTIAEKSKMTGTVKSHDGPPAHSTARSEKKPKKSSGGEEVGQLLRSLCDSPRSTHGNRNASLYSIPDFGRQPTTPELLKILEQTIEKKTPKKPERDGEKKQRIMMNLNIPEKFSKDLFQYRTKYIQYMLTSPMYANSVVGKPWELIANVSEQLIDNMLSKCVKEMRIENIVTQLCQSETT